jgi:hypothetical protein
MTFGSLLPVINGLTTLNALDALGIVVLLACRPAPALDVDSSRPLMTSLPGTQPLPAYLPAPSRRTTSERLH